jgi:hypothetical protein
MIWKTAFLLIVMALLTTAATPTPEPSLFDRLIALAPTLQPGQACVTLAGDLTMLGAQPGDLVPPWRGNAVRLNINPDPYDPNAGPSNNRSLSIRSFATSADAPNEPIPFNLQVLIFAVEFPLEHHLIVDIEQEQRPIFEPSAAFALNRLSPLGMVHMRRESFGPDARGDVYVWAEETDEGELFRAAFQFYSENRDGDAITATGAAAALWTPDPADALTPTPPAPLNMPIIGTCESTLLAS